MPEIQPRRKDLPRGVTDGVWQYVQTERIATEYDAYFSQNSLFDFDQQVLAQYLRPPGLVLDLGCGTGRSLIPLARRGLRGVGVDLSRHMLRIAGQKARQYEVSLGLVQANLTELGCLPSESAEYCICMFSTLGMIRGRDNRRRVLGHVQRILKPGGVFVLHAHNLWYNPLPPRHAGWLARHLLLSLCRRDLERGDKIFQYRGVPQMFLHSFSRPELVRALSAAKFHIEKLIPLHASRCRPLSSSWLFGWLRANGWIAVCRK